jgi:hypothetical protein
MGKKSGSGSGMRELKKQFFWVKILKILRCGSGIRDGKLRIRAGKK